MKNYYAVIGSPIGHSLSPVIHEMFARLVGVNLFYDKIQVREDDFEQAVYRFFDSGGSGLNITSPFKQRAYQMAKARSRACKYAKAANTLLIHQSGKLYADSTDGAGLVNDLERYLSITDKRLLLLGTGGAARAVINSLLAENPQALTVAGRCEQALTQVKNIFPEIETALLQDVDASFDIIINATTSSLKGEIPAINASLIKGAFCYDMFYDRKPTVFIQWCLAHKALEAVDGIGMLVEQAAESFALWHGIRPETEAVLEALKYQS